MKRKWNLKAFFTSKVCIVAAAVLAVCLLSVGVVFAVSRGSGGKVETNAGVTGETDKNMSAADGADSSGGKSTNAAVNSSENAAKSTESISQGNKEETKESKSGGNAAGTTQNQTHETQAPRPTDGTQPGQETQAPQRTQETQALQPTDGTQPGQATQPTQSPQSQPGQETQETQAPQPTQPAVKTAESILAEMTLEEKIGQMFIARCPDSNAVQLAERYQLGGYILFARDFRDRTKQQVISTIDSYQRVSKVPMFIGVDEEGGKVNRVSLNAGLRAQPFMSPQELYSLGGYDMVRSDTYEKSTLLKSLGINMNFAPVADVSQNPQDFIYQRTFGRSAAETSQYVSNVVSVMKQQKIVSVLKHFPGYGNNSDTHTGIAYDQRSYESFQTSDFFPFKAGVSAGADAVLVAHNVVYCMDSVYPASLSENVHKILREEIGFDGIIITDELSMSGVSAFASDADIAVLAVQAGNDLLCCTNFEIQINAVINAVRDGRISENRIDESVLRILRRKISSGII